MQGKADSIDSCITKEFVYCTRLLALIRDLLAQAACKVRACGRGILSYTLQLTSVVCRGGIAGKQQFVSWVSCPHLICVPVPAGSASHSTVTG
jgi:hypothetical protein